MEWKNLETIPSKEYKCGYCEREIASNMGISRIGQIPRNYYGRHDRYEGIKGLIYICHNCHSPTYFDMDHVQHPGVSTGNLVKNISNDNVENLYLEARNSISAYCFTATVMLCRKLLMNISVAKGAEEGLRFIQYVNFLQENNYIPPNGVAWVEEIRRIGNETNHRIEIKTLDEASKILIFTEMLLRFIYELPGMLES